MIVPGPRIALDSSSLLDAGQRETATGGVTAVGFSWNLGRDRLGTTQPEADAAARWMWRPP
jgi:hypothetical protein